MKLDELVKSRESIFGVIPAQAGIQYYKMVVDSRLRGNDTAGDFLT